MDKVYHKNKTKFLLLSCLLLLSQEVIALESVYIGGIGGVLLTRDLAVNKSNLLPDLPSDVEIQYKPGYKIGLFAGLKFPYFRAEAEFSRLKSEAKEVVVQGRSTPISLGGNVTTNILMANGLLFMPGTANFYGGGGIGYVSVDNSLNNSSFRLNKSLDNKMVGYQGIVGISIKLNIFNIFIDYRYIGTIGDVEALNKPYSNNTANMGVFIDIG